MAAVQLWCRVRVVGPHGCLLYTSRSRQEAEAHERDFRDAGWESHEIADEGNESAPEDAPAFVPVVPSLGSVQISVREQEVLTPSVDETPSAGSSDDPGDVRTDNFSERAYGCLLYTSRCV